MTDADPSEESGGRADAGRTRGRRSGAPAGRRTPRRAHRPPTNPDTDESPDVVEPSGGADESGSAHDRWLREQRPPHWE